MSVIDERLEEILIEAYRCAKLEIQSADLEHVQNNYSIYKKYVRKKKYINMLEYINSKAQSKAED